MFTILLITAAVELVLYTRIRRDRPEPLSRTAHRRLVAQRGPQRLRLI